MPSFRVPVLGLAVRFLSPFPDSLPQLFLRCLLPAFAFRIFPVLSAFFRPLLSRFRLLSLCFFLSALPASASQQLPRCFDSALASSFSPFLPAWFPMLSFPVPVLGLLFVSFRPSQLRSHSRSAGASLPLSLPGFPLLFPLSFVRFFSGSDYSASASSVPFSSRFCLTAASPVLRTFLSVYPFFHFPSTPVSRASVPFLVLGFLFVSFRPSLIRSHSCSSGAYLLLSLSVFSRSSPLPFVRFLFRSDYSASALSFPFIPVFPTHWFSPVPVYPLSVPPVSMLPFQLWYSAFLFFPSPVCVSPRSGYLTALGFPCGFSRFPLVNTLGSGYSA